MKFDKAERTWEALNNTPPDDPWEPKPWCDTNEFADGISALKAAISALDERMFPDLRDVLAAFLAGYTGDTRCLQQLRGSLLNAWEIGSGSYDCDEWGPA